MEEGEEGRNLEMKVENEELLHGCVDVTREIL